MTGSYKHSSARVLTTVVRRMRNRPENGGETLFFKLQGFGKSGRFLRPDAVPDFDGDEAVFEYEKLHGQIVPTRLVRVTKP